MLMDYNVGMTTRTNKSKPNISIRIDKDTHQQAKVAAAKEGITLGAWLEQAIRMKLVRDPKQVRLSKAEIAKRLGVSKSYITQISNGQKPASKRIINGLFKLLY